MASSRTKFSGCETGNGRSNRASTTLKINVFAQIPTASTNAAAAVNTGLFASRVMLDGVNDLFVMLRSPDTLDAYSLAGLGDEFDGLTNPASMSLRLMSSTWLLDRSSLYRLIRERVSRRNQLRARAERVRQADAHPQNVSKRRRPCAHFR